MAMTREETIASFMKDIEDLRNSVDTETYNAVMRSWANGMQNGLGTQTMNNQRDKKDE